MLISRTLIPQAEGGIICPFGTVSFASSIEYGLLFYRTLIFQVKVVVDYLWYNLHDFSGDACPKKTIHKLVYLLLYSSAGCF